jgi:ABC-2 type transport system permease protein
LSSFFQLVQNENMKIYRRPCNWVMAGFIVLALVTFTIFTNLSMNKVSDSDNWKPQLEQSILLQFCYRWER